MAKKQKIQVLASIFLLTFGILFFSLAVQKYQVLTSSQAASRGLGINFTISNDSGNQITWRARVDTSDPAGGIVVNEHNQTLTHYAVYHCPQSVGPRGETQGGAGYCIPENGGERVIYDPQRLIPARPVGTTFEITHPIENCGRYQIDLGDPDPNTQGGIFGGDVFDTGVSCETEQPTDTPPTNTPPPGSSPTPELPTFTPVPTTSTSEQCPAPINVQFMLSQNEGWIAGSEVTSASPTVPFNIDINCFAEGGLALLSPAVITVNGTQVANGPEVRDYAINSAGTYNVVCSSTQLNNCSDTDSFTIANTPSVTPSRIPTTHSTPSLTPTNTSTPTLTPTNTPTPTSTPTNTPTLTPTPTITPSATPTNTPMLSSTVTSGPVPTDTLIATNIPGQPTNPPGKVAPTNTIVPALEVDGQKPGITPWIMVLIPVGLVLLGLLL